MKAKKYRNLVYKVRLAVAGYGQAHVLLNMKAIVYLSHN